jgi:glucokinase
MHTSSPRLLADIGGTHARLAWQAGRDAPLLDVATYPCAQHDSLQSAIRHYLAQHDRPAPRRCAIGIANPVTGDRVQMTNHHWSFSISELQRSLGFERLVVLNDFTALALSLPSLTAAERRAIGGGAAVPGAPVALVGAGTGLGVSGLLWAGPEQCVPVSGEGGHTTLAAADDQEAAVIGLLRRRFGHASAERALSGQGLVNLYQALCELRDLPCHAEWDAAAVSCAGLAGDDAQCTDAIAMFCSLLGTLAGNLALTLGARGGVYVGGGIVPRWGEAVLAHSRFRERFEAKGRFAGYLRDIPTWLIVADTSPALLGAARALDQG